MRKSVLSSVLAVTIVLGAATSGVATVSNWSAVVNSGGVMKYHLTNRVTTIPGPWVAVTTGPTAKVVLTDCTSYHNPITAVKTIANSGAAGMGLLPVGTCFRMGIGRANGTDTNGILPGYGVTDLAGRVEY